MPQWSRAIVLVAGFFGTISGCDLTAGSDVHLLPEGFTGPVVLVFDDPTGIAPQHDTEGSVVYDIPSNGVLRLRSGVPPGGVYKKRFYYVDAAGSRTEIPYHENGGLQVFADIVGVTAWPVDGVEQQTRWAAYVVGDPSQRGDWTEQRIKATEDAIGAPPSIRVTQEDLLH